MTFFTNQNYKWTIIILFLGLIIAPAQMPSPTFKSIALAVLGGGCLFFELLSLRSLKKDGQNFRTEFRQTTLLITLTALLLVVNLVI
ncbi:hypothetical protein Emtol_3291 [Emticicia oligotrophica DSM 17448]|uniref:Uncharacterized protein n=1 Tax=Emticicia oligotrophica (strain DSM 17448 / CIP 109782 / MTCC 6937 / GPTSA100-15) TaxID=929562 RepID=A0ABM5N4K3_EMTOG|nr:hypothetical protein [Emticicia oligotrophica]AFK04420.1 hypothetical protein Emtol_3291 [Emticicia oligotrophica DSM 17448]